MNGTVFRRNRAVNALVCLSMLCAAAVCATSAQAEGPERGRTITGLVCDAVTSRTLQGAAVFVIARNSDAPPVRATTGERGLFEVHNLQPAFYIVEVSKEGYRPGRAEADLREREAARLVFKLAPREIRFGVVEGVVRDEETDAPIAGAIVSYSRTTSGEIVSVRTNERGAYRLPGVPAGLQPLRASHREYLPQDKRVEVPAGGAAVLNFDLERRPPSESGVLEGIVRNRVTRAPIAGARIVIDGFFARILILTAENGTFRVQDVPSGRREAVASKEGFIPQGRIVEIPRGGATFVEFALAPIADPPRGSLYGVVTDAETGDPLPGAIVTLTPPDDREYVAARTDDSQPYVVTDRAGRYAFPGLPVGVYAVKAAKRGYEPQAQRAVIEADRRTELNFELKQIVVPTSGALFGQVTDAETGDPIANALVMLGGGLNDAERLTDRANTETHTNENGFYVFRKVMPGEYIVYAYARGHHPARALAEVEAGGETRVDFELRPIAPPDLGAISGQVTDGGTSEPIANALVFVPLANPTRASNERNALYARTNERGNYLIEDVPPGLRLLIAHARGYIEGEETVQVLPGETATVDFALERQPVRPGIVRIRVLNSRTGRPIDGARIRLAISRWIDPDSEWNPWGGSSGPDGTGAFADVPQGAWPVVGFANGYIAGFGALEPPAAPGPATALQAAGDEEVTIFLDPALEATGAGEWGQYQ